MAGVLSIVVMGVIGAGAPVVVVDRDNVEIRTSCTVRVDVPRVLDADGNGVVHVTGDGITVDFAGATLVGAAVGQTPDTFSGIGVRITGRGVTLKGARVSGYKVGVHATNAYGFVIEDCDVSNNFRLRLKSTPRAEDASDWLSPHANDDNEWLKRYGAGVYIEDANDITVRRVKARHVQNGIILDRVNGASVYDNDCSFLSGWGLALWRSSDNLVSRNAFDFCIRGYSHGVYNRGQDSAGILMFEQCSGNIIAENSATHCGDGLFGFAGNEALGRANPRDDLGWYKQRGNNGNLLVGNDFSYAAAHGIEMTFSSSNRFFGNRLVGNAICGIWAGYSRHTTIQENTFEANGEMAYGLERGGINIEHGVVNTIHDNSFTNNACGIYLWWDEDEGISKLPWARANDVSSSRNLLTGNRFEGDRIGIQLRRTSNTMEFGSIMEDVATPFDTDAVSEASFTRNTGGVFVFLGPPPDQALGSTRPVGARKHLRGREHIIMTEWGPYDWEAPLLTLIEQSSRRHVYRMLGDETIESASLAGPEAVTLSRGEGDSRLTVSTEARGILLPYTLTVTTESSAHHARGTLVPAQWSVLVFAYRTDPREDLDAWQREAQANGVACTVGALDLRYQGGGPSELDLDRQVTEAALPTDHFGTIANTKVKFPAGRWRLRTTSDDGIRVWVGEDLVIDDWTWHAPKEHTYEFSLDQPKQLEIRVEHFELDGYAILTLEIEEVMSDQ